MAINYNNSVSNGTGTPTAITGVIADRPAATDVAEGTIFISTDTQEIFTAQAGSWINVVSGGGGSQNLDQVLAVGNTANNKGMYLNGIDNFLNQIFYTGLNFIGYFTNEEFTLNYYPTPPYDKLFKIKANGIQQLFRISNQTGSAGSYKMGLFYENDDNGKNLFYVRTLGIFIGQERRYEVNASYTGGNSIELSEADTVNDSFASVKTEAQGGGTTITLKSSAQYSLNVYQQLVLSSVDFIFYDIVGNSVQIIPIFPPAGNIQAFLPEYNGKIANVNERIVDSSVNLSLGNYQCNTYGVYVIRVGSSVNDFDLTQFTLNGQDGEFVTLCVQNTNVNCYLSPLFGGTIYGVSNINKIGLYKLMKIGYDIYSSHI